MVSISKNLGCYNFLSPSDKSWNVCINLGNGMVLNQNFDEDEEPDIDMPPSQLVDVFEDKLKRYLFNSRREKMQEIIDYIKNNAKEVDIDWYNGKILSLQKKMARDYKVMNGYRYEVEDLQYS